MNGMPNPLSFDNGLCISSGLFIATVIVSYISFIILYKIYNANIISIRTSTINPKITTINKNIFSYLSSFSRLNINLYVLSYRYNVLYNFKCDGYVIY